jgi:formylmethanofuran dehydrogenase subunit B
VNTLLRTFENIACTICACVCDDLRITVAGGRISKCEGGLRAGRALVSRPGKRLPPLAMVEGQPVALETAAAQAGEILEAASSPLIYGLSRGSTEGQSAAVSLGERVARVR